MSKKSYSSNKDNEEKIEIENEDDMRSQLKDKSESEEGVNIGVVKGESYSNLSEDEQNEIRLAVMKELKKSEDALAEDIMTFPDVKKGYLDNERRDDPFYIDYNLLYNNVDMMMALSYSNEIKADFIGSDSSDYGNANVISKTFEYDYKSEMGMDLLEYELLMDKFLGGVSCIIREWNDERKCPSPKCGPVEYFRPDPMGRGHVNKYRYMGWYGKMTKSQMKASGDYFNVEEVIDTDWTTKENSDKSNNGSNVTITPDDSQDDSAYFAIYNHFRTNEDGKICLVTLANGGSLVIRYIELDYEIGGKPVIPVSLDFWKPKRGFPKGIKPYDLTSRKQKVLSLMLNLAVKKAVRSSLGNHLIVDEQAIKNKTQLSQLTEFPEVILVDTANGQKNVNNIVSELQRSQVPQDNYSIEDRIKQLNYEETSIGPNQLGISPTGNQTATEIKDNASNSNIRLSLVSRISMIFWTDFLRKWFMMYNSHFKEGDKKQIIISREFGDRYLTFENKYLTMSQDPHIQIKSKFDVEQKNKQLFSNHVVLYTYIQQLASQASVPLSVRLAMRKALRLLGYPEDEIIDYVPESAEEQEAKQQLYMLNNDEKLEKLSPDQIDENHDDYLHVYRQAKENSATKSAVLDRIKMKKKSDAKKIQMQAQQMQEQNTGGMQNQMTANMIGQNNAGKQSTMSDIQL